MSDSESGLPACGCDAVASRQSFSKVSPITALSIGPPPKLTFLCVIMSIGETRTVSIALPPTPISFGNASSSHALQHRHLLLRPPTRRVSLLDVTVSDESACNVPISVWGDSMCAQFTKFSVGDVLLCENIGIKYFRGERQLSVASRTRLRRVFGKWFFTNSLHTLATAKSASSSTTRTFGLPPKPMPHSRNLTPDSENGPVKRKIVESVDATNSTTNRAAVVTVGDAHGAGKRSRSTVYCELCHWSRCMARKIFQTHLVHFRAALLRHSLAVSKSWCANTSSGKEPTGTNVHVHNVSELKMPTNSGQIVIDNPVQLVAIFMPHVSTSTARPTTKHHQDDVSNKLSSLDAVLVVVDHTTSDPGSIVLVAEQVDTIAVLQSLHLSVEFLQSFQLVWPVISGNHRVVANCLNRHQSFDSKQQFLGQIVAVPRTTQENAWGSFLDHLFRQLKSDTARKKKRNVHGNEVLAGPSPSKRGAEASHASFSLPISSVVVVRIENVTVERNFICQDGRRPLVTLKPHSSLVSMHQYVAVSVAGRYLRMALVARGSAAHSAPQATESPSRAFDALRERFELDRSMRQCCAEAVSDNLRTSSCRTRNGGESLVASFAATATQTQVRPDSLSATAVTRDPDKNLADIDHVFLWHCSLKRSLYTRDFFLPEAHVLEIGSIDVSKHRFGAAIPSYWALPIEAQDSAVQDLIEPVCSKCQGSVGPRGHSKPTEGQTTEQTARQVSNRNRGAFCPSQTSIDSFHHKWGLGRQCGCCSPLPMWGYRNLLLAVVPKGATSALFVIVLRTIVREVLMMNIPASHLAAEQEGWDYPGLKVSTSNCQPSKRTNDVASSAARAVFQALASPPQRVCFSPPLRLQVSLAVPLSDESGIDTTESSVEWSSQPSDLSSSSVTAGAQGTPDLALRKSAWILRSLDM